MEEKKLLVTIRKPWKYLGTEYPEGFGNWVYIYSAVDFPVLTKFQEGYWVSEYIREPSFEMSHQSYTRYFREGICQSIYGRGYQEVFRDLKTGVLPLGSPFSELILFSDCEGYLDWGVASKLLEDFKKHIPGFLLGWYMEVLRKCIEIRGVVDYH